MPTFNICIFTLISVFFIKSLSISLRLMKHRQICINIPTPNTYQFEYSVSNQNEQNILCVIYNNDTEVLDRIQYKSTYKAIINITSQEGKICFTPLDTLTKIVSFDLIPTNDPMRGQIIQKDLNQLFNQMDTLYRNIERLYRNQHFYYERNRAHKQILNSLQLKLKLIKGWKVVILLICGAFQYFFIKKLIDRKDTLQSSNNTKKRIDYYPISSI